jgi:hypothetical protein
VRHRARKNLVLRRPPDDAHASCRAAGHCPRERRLPNRGRRAPVGPTSFRRAPPRGLRQPRGRGRDRTVAAGDARRDPCRPCAGQRRRRRRVWLGAGGPLSSENSETVVPRLNRRSTDDRAKHPRRRDDLSRTIARGRRVEVVEQTRDEEQLVARASHRRRLRGSNVARPTRPGPRSRRSPAGSASRSPSSRHLSRRCADKSPASEDDRFLQLPARQRKQMRDAARLDNPGWIDGALAQSVFHHGQR